MRPISPSCAGVPPQCRQCNGYVPRRQRDIYAGWKCSHECHPVSAAVRVLDEIEPVFGYCSCGLAGDWLVWNKAGTIGTFTCPGHLPFVKKDNQGGEVEKM